MAIPGWIGYVVGLCRNYRCSHLNQLLRHHEPTRLAKTTNSHYPCICRDDTDFPPLPSDSRKRSIIRQLASVHLDLPNPFLHRTTKLNSSTTKHALHRVRVYRTIFSGDVYSTVSHLVGGGLQRRTRFHWTE